MRKSLITILCIAALILLAGIWFGGVPEPRYNGVRLGVLLESNPTPGAGLTELQEAVKVLGPKSVPYLASVLEREPTSFHQLYGRTVPNLSSKIQKVFPRPKNFTLRRTRAAAALMHTGANGVAAIPVLILTATNDAFFGTRHNAVGALAMIAPGTGFEEAAATAIISRTTDENQALREHAYSSLGAFTNQMDKVVPMLLHGLRNPAVRDFAMISLRRLGTNVMPIVRQKVQNEGYLPMSFEALERELAGGSVNAE